MVIAHYIDSLLAQGTYCFTGEEHQVSRAEFEINLFQKLNDRRFLNDMAPLLTTGASWDWKAAALYVLNTLVPLLPGDAWVNTEAQKQYLKDK